MLFSMSRGSIRRVLPVLLILAKQSAGHDHDTGAVPDGEFTSPDPLDAILWVHILLMMLTFGVIFPTGMVLGIVRNRWHVPTQVLGTSIAVLAYFLGHMHGGRAFKKNAHGSFANVLMILLAIQVVFGVYLKLHITKGFHGSLRKVIIHGHGIVGKIMPVISWVQMLLGGITALGYCHEDHFGQCLAHFIMGSAFIAYGIVSTIIMLVGQAWIKRTGRSQEFFDSAIIAAWGCVNTFTEHRWGESWSGGDVQHTTMGIIWWCAGLTGVWLSRKRDGSPKRNFVPGFVILLTGWAMSAHSQHLPLSTMVHTVFGYTLMGAGLTRIIEVAFVLRDANTISEDGDANSFQYIPLFLLYASGFLFMGATEEQLKLISDAGITHVPYILVLYSFAFLLFLLVNMLLHLFALNASPATLLRDGERIPDLNGNLRSIEGRQVREAEEFELEGLISEDESPESPSTLGKNNKSRA